MEDQQPSFNITVGDLWISAKIVPVLDMETEYSHILLNNTKIVLVSFNFAMRGDVEMEGIQIIVPFYKPPNGIMSCAWFPFHCASNDLELTSEEYYFRSNHGAGYIYKQGHYVKEPFDEGKGSGCILQRQYFMELISVLPAEDIYPDPDNGIGIFTALKRFGNFLYLSAFYSLFGVDQNADENSKSFADFLSTNQIGEKILDGVDLSNPLRAADGYDLNFILLDNEVVLPHHQEAKRSENSPDAKFVLYMKILQTLSEITLIQATEGEGEEYFLGVLEDLVSLVKKAVALDKGIKVFAEWSLLDIFTEEASILYR